MHRTKVHLNHLAHVMQAHFAESSSQKAMDSPNSHAGRLRPETREYSDLIQKILPELQTYIETSLALTCSEVPTVHIKTEID